MDLEIWAGRDFASQKILHFARVHSIHQDIDEDQVAVGQKQMVFVCSKKNIYVYLYAGMNSSSAHILFIMVRCVAKREWQFSVICTFLVIIQTAMLLDTTASTKLPWEHLAEVVVAEKGTQCNGRNTNLGNNLCVRVKKFCVLRRRRRRSPASMNPRWDGMQEQNVKPRIATPMNSPRSVPRPPRTLIL